MKAEAAGLKKAVVEMARRAVGEVGDGFTVGLGSGWTAGVFVSELAEQVEEKRLEVYVIPSSLQIQLVAEALGLRIASLKPGVKVDITVDGADQIDGAFCMIKGGGGALYRERVLLRAAKRSVILADESKYVERLSRPVPVETSFFARSFVSDELVKLGGRPALRLLDRGYPFTTENGNLILDTDFGAIQDPRRLRGDIVGIAGVVEAGVFVDEGDIFYKACGDGSAVRFEAR